MKITEVKANNHKRAFEVASRGRTLVFPYSESSPTPSSSDRIREVYVDKEVGSEAFTYVLESGREGTVHMDHVLEYNKDPGYMADVLLYNLTLEAQKRVRESSLSTREIIRRLDTSATQFYRLLDQTNYSKSLNQLVELLAVLDCEVELIVKRKQSA